MSSISYTKKLEYVRDIYPGMTERYPSGVDIADLSPYEKGDITRTYNAARLLTAPSTLADRRDKSDLDYRYMLETIRPFARGFDPKSGYDLRSVDDLTPSQKGRLTKTYRDLSEAAAQPFYAYRTPNKKKLKQVREAIGQKDIASSSFAFVPISSTLVKPKITVKKSGVVSIKTKNIEKMLIRFEDFGFTTRDFANDPKGVVDSVVEMTGFPRYSIVAGIYEVTQQKREKNAVKLVSAAEIANEVELLVSQYGADKHDPNDKNSHYFGNWLFGIRGYKFDNPRTMLRYTRSDREARTSRTEQRQNIAKQLTRRRKGAKRR